MSSVEYCPEIFTHYVCVGGNSGEWSVFTEFGRIVSVVHRWSDVFLRFCIEHLRCMR